MSKNNGNRVAIVGHALTDYGGTVDMLIEELTFKVTSSAFKDIGITREDVDAVIVSQQDTYDGLTMSQGFVTPAAGGYLKDSTRNESGGAFAIINAYATILAGSADCVVVASADATEFNPLHVSNFSYEPFFRRPIGMNSMLACAMLAQTYMDRCGASEEDYAKVTAKNYAAGAGNPYAHIKGAYSFEDVMDSPITSWPFREKECPPLSFGAGVLILASEDLAKQLTKDPVWITSCGIGAERYFGDWNDLAQMSALKAASSVAFNRAGIKVPRKEIDLIEVSSPFPPLELLEYEALDLCDKGKGLELFRDGSTYEDGVIPVNVSGGTICTNGPNSNGIFKTIQAAMYLKGELPKSNSNARRAVICDSDMYLGMQGSTHAVLVLERG